MIKLKLLLLTLILLGPCAFAYARHRRPVGRTIPVVMCAYSVSWIALGYVLPFSAAIGITAVISAAMWLYALIGILRNKQPVLPVVLPVGLFFCGAVLLYDACAPRLFLSYDEYSHWGMIVKAISLFDELPRSGGGAAYIQYTYPPSAAMLPAMAAAILGYRDGIAYLGYALLLAGLLWGIAAKSGRSWSAAAAFAALYLCVMAIFPMSILRLFIEPAAALLMVLIITDAYGEETQPLWITALYAVMLAMIKNTGLVFVGIALLIRWFARPEKREVLDSLKILGVSMLAVISYRAYCGIQGIEAVISPSHLGENLKALMAGTLDETYLQLPARFIRFFFEEKLPQSGIYSCYGFGTSAQVFAVVLLLCAAHVLIARRRSQAIRMWCGVWLCNLLYLLMIAVSYFVGFELEEVARLAEADRYISIIPLWTGVLAVAMLALERNERHPMRNLALLGVVAVILLPLSHPDMTVKTFVTKEYVQNTEWARTETARIAAFIRGAIPAESRDKLLCIGDYNYIELHFELAGDVDIGRLDQNDGSWRSGPDGLHAAVERGGYDHVFVGAIDEEAERFVDVTTDGAKPQAYSLYRVEQGQDGSVKLCRFATMTDNE